MKGKARVVFASLLVMSLWWPWSVAQAAGSIIGVTLMDAADGDVVRIEADRMGSFEHFDLDHPDRLLLKFKGTRIKPDVRDIQASGEGVRAVRLGMDGKDSVVEITLSSRIPYRIEQKLNAVLVRFASGGVSDGAMLSRIQVVDRDDMTELVLKGQHMDASHNVFMTEDRKRLILDLWGGRSALPKEFYEYAAQRVRNVVIGQAEDRLRIIVTLVPGMGMLQQQVEARPTEMIVRLGKVRRANLAVPQVVEGIDFEPQDDEAQIVVRSSSVEPVVSVHEENDNVIIDLQHMKLAKGLERSLDVRQFPGPVAQIDSYQLGDQVRIVARLRRKARYSSFQQGNVFTLRLAPREGARGVATAGGGMPMKYAGQKVTFNMKDMDLRNALTLIAEMSNLNIIMSEEVQGKITMRLIDVPWDQALDLILATKGLGKEQMGNVLRIAPLTTLQEEYQNKLAARQGSEQLEPLITEFITLNFAKASDVQQMLNKASGGGKGGKKQNTSQPAEAGSSDSLLSPRGSVLVDARTNTLIVKDTRAVINNIKRLLAKIDQPVRQVLIESRIVEATDSFVHDIGIRWGGYANQTTGFNFPGVVSVGAPGTTLGNATTFAAGGGAAGMVANNLVDLPAAVGPGAGGAIGLTLGSFNGAVNLNLELSAAEADDKIKIVSSPRVITSNMKPATISQGVQVPVTTPGTANNPPTTTLQNALLTLSVTPQITSDDGIIMDVVVTKDSPVIFNGATGINKKEVNTSVYMRSGETVVIGGIYTQDKSDNRARVPWLADLPVVGALFRKRSQSDIRNELLIFLTPKVLKQGVSPMAQ